MAENETSKDFTATQKRNTVGGVKILINAIVALIVTLALVLSSFFLFGGMAMKLSDWAFWTQKLICGVATFVLMLSISNITEEVARKKDADLNKRLNALDTHYQTLMQNYETDSLEIFLTNINKANKYTAYINKCKRQLKHARRAETKEKIHNRLLIDAEELWNSEIKVRYYKITYNQLVSGAFDVSPSDSEYDLNVHRARYGAQKFGGKILGIIAFGGVCADMVYSYLDFTKAMIVPLIFKIATIMVAVYSGVCFGYFIIERTKTVTKGKLRIFSKFRARVDNKDLSADDRFAVPIEKDIVVEKVKAQVVAENEKKSLLKQTYDDTFGNRQPVKVGGFVKKYVENAITAEGEQRYY